MGTGTGVAQLSGKVVHSSVPSTSLVLGQPGVPRASVPEGLGTAVHQGSSSMEIEQGWQVKSHKRKGISSPARADKPASALSPQKGTKSYKNAMIHSQDRRMPEGF